MVISQKNILTRIELNARQDEIEYRRITPWKRQERIIQYKELTGKFERIAQGSKIVRGIGEWLWIMGAIILTIDFIGFEWDISRGIVYIGLAVIFATLYIVTITEKWRIDIETAEPIEIYAEKPNSQDVLDLIQTLKQKRKESMLEVYGDLNDFESKEDQMNRLRYLRSKQVISKNEYETMKTELDSKIGEPTQRKIGFEQNRDGNT